jgi:putative hydroxymethylpyrimidine transport system substrate-binding protein
MTRRVLSALLTVMLACGLVACGEKDEPGSGAASGPNERLNLLLDYLPNADHAGIYAAIGSGEFKTAALDVRVRTPSDPSLPLKLLAAGKADLAISYEPELLLARAKGAKLVSIGALVQKPLTSIVSLGHKAIKQPSELAGKTVGTAGIPYQDAYLKTILAGAGVDAGKVKAINVGFTLVPTLLSKRVDAVLGMFWNVEGVQLARQHRKPEILRVDSLGVPTYNELIIVAREQDVRSRGQVLRRFMRALGRGHAILRGNIGAGVNPLVKSAPDLDPAVQRAQVEATLPVFFPLGGKRPFGFQDPNEWRRYAQWMADRQLIPSANVAQRAFTNEFLPGEGV